jgi:hypothetical protein
MARFNNTVNANNVVTQQNYGYVAEVDNGNSGTAKTIDFTTGTLQKVSLTGTCAFTLTAPTLPGYVQLKMTAASGVGQPTFTNTINWFEASTPPTINLTIGKISMYSLFWDGANWLGSGGRFGI